MSALVAPRVRLRAASAPRGRGVVPELPAWPLVVMITAFPVEWALGIAAFGPDLIAVLMLALMGYRRRLSVVPGVLPWFVFFAWTFGSAVTLKSGSQALGYVEILGTFFAAGVGMLYYINARERIPARTVISALVVLWVSIVVLGVLATQFPTVRLTTPFSFVLPQSLKSNDLVYQLVYPRMAEVQQPYGAPVPFNRPAAPFPYANSWGAAYALLTPVVFAYLTLRPRRWVRWVLGGLLVVSIYPAIETSDRGMIVALLIAIAYFVIRLTVRGRLAAAIGAVALAGSAVVYLIASGSLAGILGRQQFSNSTSTRSNVYLGTIQATAKSPFLGWATPQTDASIGTPLGSQGFGWQLMFSYGFVGLAIFLFFVAAAVFRTAKAPTTAELWLHAALVMVIVMMWYYGLAIQQLIVFALIAAILLRARANREVLE